MPIGVYKRTPEHMAKIRAIFAKGRTKESYAKKSTVMRKITNDPEWKRKASKRMKKIMNRPDTRKRHLNGIKKYQEEYGVNFRGGISDNPLPLIKNLHRYLEPLGFKLECRIKVMETDKRGRHKFYFADFGHCKAKVAIEIDGPSHNGTASQERDERRQKAIEAVGWVVLRFTNEQAKSIPKKIARAAGTTIINRTEDR